MLTLLGVFRNLRQVLPTLKPIMLYLPSLPMLRWCSSCKGAFPALCKIPNDRELASKYRFLKVWIF